MSGHVSRVPSISDSDAKVSLGAVSSLTLTKGEQHMQWWLFGPVVLAIVMFLLVGTLFERRIEAFWQHLLDRRQAMLSQHTDPDPPLTNNSLHTVKTPSQRTLGSNKDGNTTSTRESEAKMETKSLTYIFGKKDFKKDDVNLSI